MDTLIGDICGAVFGVSIMVMFVVPVVTFVAMFVSEHCE